jgi:hypothetical protein
MPHPRSYYIEAHGSTDLADKVDAGTFPSSD